MPGSCLLFWDYDTQWGIDRSRGHPAPGDWGEREFVNTERLLDLHARFDLPACFAIVGQAALPGNRPYHDPAQIRRIHAAGHEIASHSFCHEWLPGMSRRALHETLHRSKDALEQCIGAPVVSFVPPFNQPFDYPAGWSFSLAERREAGRDRTDLRRLCETLAECGYRFARVAYQSLPRRLMERLRGRSLDTPVQPEQIAGITCLRLTCSGGFGERAQSALRACAAQGGWTVLYGHPHSLYAGNSQDERYLIPLLELVAELRAEGVLKVALPRQLVATEAHVDTSLRHLI